MIYFYSATGNTRYAAEFLGRRLNGEIIDVIRDKDAVSTPVKSEWVGFMFPIYCWGVPPVMQRFVSEKIKHVPKDTYLWIIATCGDDCGTALRTLNELIVKGRGRGADAIFTLIMPNTYVLLPGFDVDSKTVEQEKLRKAPELLSRMADAIEAEESGIYDVKEGSVPRLKSALFPLFEKWGVRPKLWKASDACIGCGKCAAICPASNIEMKEKRPVWGRNCYSCCGCFHVCPVKAVSYGKITLSKSQYLCPLI